MEQKCHDRSVDALRCNVDVRLHHVFDIGYDQLIVKLRAIRAEVEDRLTLSQRVMWWDLLCGVEVCNEVAAVSLCGGRAS